MRSLITETFCLRCPAAQAASRLRQVDRAVECRSVVIVTMRNVLRLWVPHPFTCWRRVVFSTLSSASFFLAHNYAFLKPSNSFFMTDIMDLGMPPTR
jgi:hypothetical protein